MMAGQTSAQVMPMLARIAAETRSSDDAKALEMIRRLNWQLDECGLSIEEVVTTAINTKAHLGRLPTAPLSKTNWRDWVRFLIARPERLPVKDREFLNSIIRWSAPKEAQARWIWDILRRIEPVGCAKWGAPK